MPLYQSAYRANHSTETALLQICNDALLAADEGEVTALCMIDLTAAFDTVDHDVLLSKLQQMFGINGVVLAAVIYQIEATEYIRWSFVWQYLDNLLSCTGLCLKTVTVYTVTYG